MGFTRTTLVPHRFLFTALIFPAVVTWSLRVESYGLHRADFEARSPSGTATPNELLRPGNDMVGLVSGRSIGSGIMVGPDWFLTAAHVPIEPSSRVRINDQPYEIIDRVVPDRRPGVEGDIALLRLDTDQPLPYLPLFSQALAGMTFTAGGFGDTYTDFDVEGRPTQEGAALRLRWGQNRFSAAGRTLEYKFDDPDTPDYVPFEAIGLSGDSGSGLLVRDGFTWKVAGLHVNRGGTVAHATPIVDHREWIEATVFGEIGEQLGQPPYVPENLPTWHGSVSSSFDGENWSFPTRGTTVHIAAARFAPHIEENDLLLESIVVADSPYPGNMIQSSRTVQLSNGLYLGSSRGEGRYVMTGGELIAPRVVLGFGGGGTLHAHGGVLNIDEVFYVGQYRAATPSDASLRSGTYLSTRNVVIGAEQEATGMLTVDSESRIDSDQIWVGIEGTGDVLQRGGTVTAESLILAKSETASATYHVEAEGHLVTDATTVGLRGTGRFVNRGVHETASLRLGAEFRDVPEMSRYHLLGGSTSVHGVLTLGTRSPAELLLHGGELSASEIVQGASGVLRVEEGQLAIGDHSSLRGHVAIGPGGSLLAEGLVDLSRADLQGISSPNPFHVAQNSLLVLPPSLSLSDQIRGDGILHVAGSDLHLPQDFALQGSGSIRDRVILSSGAAILASGPLALETGIVADNSSVVDLGGGRLTVRDDSLLTAAYFAGNLVVADQGLLRLAGATEGEMRVDGTLHIIDDLHHQGLLDSPGTMRFTLGEHHQPHLSVDGPIRQISSLELEMGESFLLEPGADLLLIRGLTQHFAPPEIRLIGFPTSTQARAINTADGIVVEFADISHDDSTVDDLRLATLLPASTLSANSIVASRNANTNLLVPEFVPSIGMMAIIFPLFTRRRKSLATRHANSRAGSGRSGTHQPRHLLLIPAVDDV